MTPDWLISECEAYAFVKNGSRGHLLRENHFTADDVGCWVHPFAAPRSAPPAAQNTPRTPSAHRAWRCRSAQGRMPHIERTWRVLASLSPVVEVFVAGLLSQHPQHKADIFDPVLPPPRGHSVPRPVRTDHSQGRSTEFLPCSTPRKVSQPWQG